jgi:hypothetical protein
MTTISQELDRLEQSISHTLSSHQELLQLQQKQVECLTQLLNSRRDAALDSHCTSAIERLTTLLDRHQQANYQVYNVLSALKQAKDAQSLTLNDRGEIATCLKLELGELAKRLKIDQPNKLLAAANSPVSWAKLMQAHIDAEGYQWQFPAAKNRLGFYHKTKLQAIGTKAVTLESSNSTN